MVAGGAHRTVWYRWKVSGLGLLARPEIEVSFPQGTSRMGNIRATGPVVLVVTPMAVGTVAGLVVLAVAAIVWRRRSRRVTPVSQPLPTYV